MKDEGTRIALIFILAGALLIMFLCLGCLLGFSWHTDCTDCTDFYSYWWVGVILLVGIWGLIFGGVIGFYD